MSSSSTWEAVTTEDADSSDGSKSGSGPNSKVSSSGSRSSRSSEVLGAYGLSKLTDATVEI